MKSFYISFTRSTLRSRGSLRIPLVHLFSLAPRFVRVAHSALTLVHLFSHLFSLIKYSGSSTR